MHVCVGVQVHAPPQFGKDVVPLMKHIQYDEK